MDEEPIRLHGELFLRPRIEEALRLGGGTHTFGDLAQRVANRRAQWWQSQDERGVIITELLDFPRLRAVNYWIAAGDLEACASLVPQIEAWAIGEGCVRAIGQGRAGFARWARSLGAVTVGTAFAKELRRQP
jgi:hypothetical protein